jgi:uncharacterized protein with FMN-binding domain/DMSO/TMAO reductase YedYZ molybdopterin-dependent catalytic subunit
MFLSLVKQLKHVIISSKNNFLPNLTKRMEANAVNKKLRSILPLMLCLCMFASMGFAQETTKHSTVTGMADGKYAVNTAVGYSNNMTVITTIEGGKITQIEVGPNKEREFYLAQVMEKLVPAIIAGQTLDVDVVTGASLSSYGLIEGVAGAIGKAGGKYVIGEESSLSKAGKGPSHPSLLGLTGEERNAALIEKNAQALVDYAPKRQTLANGVQVQKIPSDRFTYNTTMLHVDKRGCTVCHALEDVVQYMAVSHPQLMMTYNVEMTYWNCLMCHTARNPLRDSIHSVHYFSDYFTGNCLSCHHLDGATGDFTLWDEVKYEVMAGFNTLPSVEGDFSFDQSVITEMDDTFWYWGNGNNRGMQPNFSDDQAIFDNWTITITGDVEEEIVLSLKELAEENSVTDVMKISCQVNQPAGSLIGNWEVTGVPVSYILSKAKLKPGADGVQFVSSDRWNAGSVALDFINNFDQGETLLVYKVNGENISPEHGYPCQVFMPCSSAATFTKCCNEFRVTTGVPLTGRLMGNVDRTDGSYFNKPNAAIFYYDQGTIFELGEPITFNGYADAFDEKIVAVEFSLDHGKHWTRYETPGTNALEWLYWTFEHTPTSMGSYVLYARGVSESGAVSPINAKLMFNVE